MAKNFTVKTVHKGMYPATHNFIAETDGTIDTNIDGITAGPLGFDSNMSATIIASEDGHRKVIKFVSDGEKHFLNGGFNLITRPELKP